MADDSLSARKLVEAALPIFGLRGLEGASTREIAKAADKPMSAITYHFGGKEGLYLAAADHIAGHMQHFMGPALDHAAQIAGSGGSIADARAAIRVMMTGMCETMLRDETAAMSRFIVREQGDPTRAFSRLYDGVMKQMLDRLTGLLIRVSGGGLNEATARIRAISLIGQVLVFRTARAALTTGMGWQAIPDDGAALIQSTIAANIDAILDQLERRNPA